MKKVFLSLTMVSAILMATIATSCKKDNAKPAETGKAEAPAKVETVPAPTANN